MRWEALGHVCSGLRTRVRKQFPIEIDTNHRDYSCPEDNPCGTRVFLSGVKSVNASSEILDSSYNLACPVDSSVHNVPVLRIEYAFALTFWKFLLYLIYHTLSTLYPIREFYTI